MKIDGNSEIRLKKSGNLFVNSLGGNHGKLKITGKPEFYLRDDETNIKIAGVLDLLNSGSASIMQDATNISRGYWQFDFGNVVLTNASSKLDMDGVDVNHRMLSIMPYTELNINSGCVFLDKGMVTYANNSQFNVNSSKVICNDARFNGKLKGEGLTILSMTRCISENINTTVDISNTTGPIIFDDCTFRYGDNAIKVSSSNILTVRECSIAQNGRNRY